MNDADIADLVAQARYQFARRVQSEETTRAGARSWRARFARLLTRWRATLRKWLIPTGSRRAYLWVSLRRKGSTHQPATPTGDNRAEYLRWIALQEPPARLPASSSSLVSVCTSADGVEPLHLAGFLESLRRQTHGRWECCVAVNEDSPVLDWYARRDRRIRPLAWKGTPLEAARGEFVTFAGADDELAPQALASLLATATQFPDADLIYSDEDRLDETGRFEPLFKSAWCPVTVRCHNTVGRLALVPRHLAGAAVDEHALWREIAAKPATVVHLPRVLYHRRAAVVEQPSYPPLTQRPLVSILIPNKDNVPLLRTCIDGIRRSTYRPFEIVIVENNSADPRTFAYYDEECQRGDCRVVKWDRPFNFAALNNEAAHQARGDVLLFLNNDIEIPQADWLEHLLALTMQPGVGAVGPHLLYPDGTVQHAGIVLGIDDQCGHWQRFTPGDDAGCGGSLRQVRPWTALTAACLMMRRDVFVQAGGFDEDFAVTFNDVDLCLRLHTQGLALLCTPVVRLIHHESQTRGLDYLWRNRARLRSEVERFRRRWASLLRAGDPFFPPHYSLVDEAVRFELSRALAAQPRVRRTAGVEQENRAAA